MFILFTFSGKKIRQITDVECQISGGDDAPDAPLSSGRNVGTKVADVDAGAASIPDSKSPGVGIAGNENVSGCEDLPPENFPPGGLDYGDALQDASSVRRCHPRMMIYFCQFLLTPLCRRRSCRPRIFFLQNPESTAILVSS